MIGFLVVAVMCYISIGVAFAAAVSGLTDRKSLTRYTDFPESVIFTVYILAWPLVIYFMRKILS